MIEPINFLQEKSRWNATDARRGKGLSGTRPGELQVKKDLLPFITGKKEKRIAAKNRRERNAAVVKRCTRGHQKELFPRGGGKGSREKKRHQAKKKNANPRKDRKKSKNPRTADVCEPGGDFQDENSRPETQNTHQATCNQKDTTKTSSAKGQSGAQEKSQNQCRI